MPLSPASPDHSPTIHLFGTRITTTVSADDTGGAWAQLDYLAPVAWAGPAPHVHDSTHEQFLVLEGELSLYSGEEKIVLQAGQSVLVPPGVPHRFTNEAETPVRFLVTVSPAGLEQYFAAVAELAASFGAWPPATPEQRQQVADLASRFDTRPA